MATNEMIRLTLLPKGAEGEAAGDRQIVIDMKIDPDTNISTGPFPAFGRVGDFRKPATLYPFTLMRDGRMDYGAYASDEQNQDKLEIRTAILTIGSEIEYKTSDKSETYVVSAIMPLLG